MKPSNPEAVIRVEHRPGVVRIVFQRPAHGNALDLAMARDTLAALRAAEADPRIHVLTLTGEGRTFCAGGDVHSMSLHDPGRRPAYLHALAGAAHDLALAIVSSRLLVLAGVNGAAAGAGLGLVLAADWVLISESAPLLAAYATIGLSPDTGVSYFLPRAIGHQRAVQLTLGGHRLKGTQAVEWNLANEAAPDPGFAERLIELEDQLAGGATSGAWSHQITAAHGCCRGTCGTPAAGGSEHCRALRASGHRGTGGRIRPRVGCSPSPGQRGALVHDLGAFPGASPRYIFSGHHSSRDSGASLAASRTMLLPSYPEARFIRCTQVGAAHRSGTLFGRAREILASCPGRWLRWDQHHAHAKRTKPE